MVGVALSERNERGTRVARGLRETHTAAIQNGPSPRDQGERRRILPVFLLDDADTLAARGVPPEFVARAGEKVATINAAWDRIKRERGL